MLFKLKKYIVDMNITNIWLKSKINLYKIVINIKLCQIIMKNCWWYIYYSSFSIYKNWKYKIKNYLDDINFTIYISRFFFVK